MCPWEFLVGVLILARIRRTITESMCYLEQRRVQLGTNPSIMDATSQNYWSARKTRTASPSTPTMPMSYATETVECVSWTPTRLQHVIRTETVLQMTSCAQVMDSVRIPCTKWITCWKNQQSSCHTHNRAKQQTGTLISRSCHQPSWTCMAFHVGRECLTS